MAVLPNATKLNPTNRFSPKVKLGNAARGRTDLPISLVSGSRRSQIERMTVFCAFLTVTGDGDHEVCWQDTPPGRNSRRAGNFAGSLKALDSMGLELYNVAIPVHSLGLAGCLP